MMCSYHVVVYNELITNTIIITIESYIIVCNHLFRVGHRISGFLYKYIQIYNRKAFGFDI